jgi:type II secretory pathway component PulJ
MTMLRKATINKQAAEEHDDRQEERDLAVETLEKSLKIAVWPPT